MSASDAADARSAGEELVVREPGRLLEVLCRALPGWKRKTLEQRVRAGAVEVDGERVLQPHRELAAGARVRVLPLDAGRVPLPAPRGFVLLHADDELVAIDKPAGLLSVPLDERRGASALGLVREWLSAPGRPARVWPVHRLDRETSGVLLFARTAAARDELQQRWSEAQKTYLAIVEGLPARPAGRIEEPLWEDAQHNVHVGRHPEAKEARTRYRVLRSEGGRALLEVELETGRRHQIRAHLDWLGHPVVGDPRRGAEAGRMGLHALRLEVPHPATQRPIRFEAPPPAAFRALLDPRARREPRGEGGWQDPRSRA